MNIWAQYLESQKAAYHGHFMCVAIKLFSKDKTSLVAQSVKKPPAMQESWVQSPGQEDPLEKGMATYSVVFLPGKLHGQRSLAGYSPCCHKASDMTEQLTLSLCKDKTDLCIFSETLSPKIHM